MGAYILNQVKMHVYHLNFETLDNEFCKFHKRKFWRNPSSGRPTWNGQRLKLLLKIFHFWEFFNLGRPPMRIRPPEKSLCFSTSFECTFEPSIIIFRAPSSTHFLSSAPSSLWPSKVVRFLTLPPFSRALSSRYLLSSAPSSLHLLSSAPLSTWPSKVVRFLTLLPFQGHLQASISFKVRLWVLDHVR